MLQSTAAYIYQIQTTDGVMETEIIVLHKHRHRDTLIGSG